MVFSLRSFAKEERGKMEQLVYEGQFIYFGECVGCLSQDDRCTS